MNLVLEGNVIYVRLIADLLWFIEEDKVFVQLPSQSNSYGDLPKLNNAVRSSNEVNDQQNGLNRLNNYNDYQISNEKGNNFTCGIYSIELIYYSIKRQLWRICFK